MTRIDFAEQRKTRLAEHDIRLGFDKEAVSFAAAISVAKIGNPANGLGCSKRRGVAVHFKYSRKKQLKT